jgi:hypothetical protein
MAVMGKIDKARLWESLDRIGAGRMAVMADVTLEALSECTGIPVDKLEMLFEPLLFDDWFSEAEPLKRQVEERIKILENVWEQFDKLITEVYANA